MDRKVYVDVKCRLIMTVPEGIEVSHVMQEMNYDFTPSTEGVQIVDTEMKDFEITDSK